jgi:hypothetical protein
MLILLLAATPAPAPAPDVDPLAIPTFVLAVLGFVGAVVALVWQFITFRLSGGRAKVDIEIASSDPSVPLSVFDMPSKHDGRIEEDGRSMLNLVRIRVRSVGRMSTNIVDCRLRYSTGALYRMTDLWEGPKLPLRMEHHASEHWTIPVSAANKVLSILFGTPGKELTVRAEIELGNGKVVKSKQRLAIFAPVPSRSGPEKPAEST